MKTLYTATATAVGGRTGHVSVEDGPIDLDLSTPKEMGGKGGDGTKPEQLFGSAYAACFGSALEAVAKEKKIKLKEVSVTAHISFNEGKKGGFLLSAVLDSYLPGVDQKTGEDLINAAHEICPFSKATRDNITVELNLLLDE